MSPMNSCSRRAPAHRLSEIEALLDQHGQQLAFEPMDYGLLFGAETGGATIGGVIAVNASGPRRIKAGAARDHLLGFPLRHRPRRAGEIRRPRDEERHRL